MQSSSVPNHIGLIVGIVGVVLILVSYLFSYIVYHGILDFVPLWMLIPLALLLLSVSVAAYFKLPRLLLILTCVFSVIGLLLQGFTYWLYQAFSCFDICISGQRTISYLMLLALSGFLLSGIGAFVTLRKSRGQ